MWGHLTAARRESQVWPIQCKYPKFDYLESWKQTEPCQLWLLQSWWGLVSLFTKEVIANNWHSPQLQNPDDVPAVLACLLISLALDREAKWWGRKKLEKKNEKKHMWYELKINTSSKFIITLLNCLKAQREKLAW